VYSLNITLYYFGRCAIRRKSGKRNNKQGVGRRRTLRTLMHYTSSGTILEDHMKEERSKQSVLRVVEMRNVCRNLVLKNSRLWPTHRIIL
jgi:hypothetical protein